jgi:transcriptional regulator with XRE-family HTH domain
METKFFRFSVTKLEAAMKKKEWSWAQLAFEMGKKSGFAVSEQRIHSWRKGVEPSGQIVALLAEVIGEPMEYFYEEVNPVAEKK